MSLDELRRQYTMGGLDEAGAPGEPIALFTDWMQIALDNAPADWVEPYAMTLATAVGADVTARIVLLRGFDHDGFVFYTNYESAKGAQLAENPSAALVFHWGYLERQVRITGSVERVNRELSETYFHKRPRGSQIGAVVSRQSERIQSRDRLEQAARQLESELDGQPVPLPDFWGGYRVRPLQMEFWQGRENRLHDRLTYTRETEQAEWRLGRLSP